MNTNTFVTRASRYPAWLALAMMAPLTGLVAMLMLAATLRLVPCMQDVWPHLTGNCGAQMVDAASAQVAQAASTVQQATDVLYRLDGDMAAERMVAHSQRAAAQAQRHLLRALRHAA